ncbi:MAG: hypothetical protein SFV17_13515 [Candidatus Obscuribacter sp.]|nr:hypothetical protein [Candidatus Obscuribacter sp.]
MSRRQLYKQGLWLVQMISLATLALAQGCTPASESSQTEQSFSFTPDDLCIYTWIELSPGDEIEVRAEGSASRSLAPVGHQDEGCRLTINPLGVDKANSVHDVLGVGAADLERSKPAPNLPGGALLLKIGKTWVSGVENPRIVIPEKTKGTLCLGLNITEHPGYRAGFRGKFNVTVKVKKRNQ